MAQQQQPNDLAVIYDPDTDRFVTASELRHPVGPHLPPGQIGISGPGDGQFVGLTLPPMPSASAENVLEAVPQIGGLVAQMVPQLRTAKAAFMVPAVVEAIMQQVRGEDFDVNGIVGQGAVGVGAHGLGAGMKMVGDVGETLVRKSLNLAGTPWANRAGEAMLPKLAIREGAEMTKEGVDAIAAKANATGSGGLQDLAEALERARLGDSLAPVGGGGGIVSMLRDLLTPPRQMALGQKAAGVGAIAPSAEAATRAFFAWLNTQLPGNQQLDQTRRRPLAP